MANIEKDQLTLYPPNYDPGTFRVQGFDQIPNATIKDPGFHWVVPRGKEGDLIALTNKGVTNFSKSDLAQPGWTEAQIVAFRDQGYGYDDVPQSPVIFGLGNSGPQEWTGPNGTSSTYPNIWWNGYYNTPPGAQEPMSAAEGTVKGNQYTVEFPVAVFETSEGTHYIGPHWAFVKKFAEAWNARVVARWPGKKTLRAWNYFTGFGETIQFSTAAERLSFVNSDPSTWPANIMLPGGNLASFNAVCYGLYLRDPTQARQQAYDMIFNAYVCKKANKEQIAFMQGFHEFLPNNNVLWTRPGTEGAYGGKFYHQNKLRHGCGESYAVLLFARIFCAAFIPFSWGGKDSRPLKLDPFWHQYHGIWVPNGNPETLPGNTSDAPVWGPPQNTPEVFPATGVVEDTDFFARWTWERSFGKVLDHDEEKWCNFRVDGGSWKTFGSQLAEGVIKGFYSDGWFVYRRKKGNKYATVVYNGYMPDSSRHKVEWQDNGEVFETWVSGTAPATFYHEF